MSEILDVLRLPMLPVPAAEVHDKCARCGGRCCSYFALQIDTPKSWAEFDDIRWYVSHGGVQVFKEGRAWYLQVETRCNHLSQNGLCGIYERRPQICRDHRVNDCEFENSDSFNYLVHFQSEDEVTAYMNQRWPKGRPLARRPKARSRSLPKALRVR